MEHQHATSNYMEHGFCFSWEPGLVWLHVASDIVTGIAYYSIPLAMFYFAYKRRDLPFYRMFLLFATFILACGTTHFFAAYTVFDPAYWPEGYVKAFTAVISICSALYVIPQIPKALTMPSISAALAENTILNEQLKATVNELTVSEHRFRTIFDSANEAVLILDLDSGAIVDANQTTIDMFGHARGEVLGLNIEDLGSGVTPYARADAMAWLHKVMGGDPQTFEWRAQDRIGRLFWAEITMKRATIGREERIFATIRDISERKRAVWRLRRLAEVVERIAGVHELAALMAVVRSAVRELTGADGATLVLRDGDECHYADEDAIGPLWKGQRFPLENCISGWSMLHAEAVVIEDIYADLRIPHEAYRPTFVSSLSMVPINREKPVGAIGCYWKEQHRATEEELGLQQALADAMGVGLANLDLIGQLELARQQAEQAADEVSSLNTGLERRVDERTAELQAANNELEAFAYSVSHDLRAPLRAMSGFSEALVEDFGDQLPGEARAYLDEIVIGSRHMGQLIDGLLTLSRCTRGELRRDPVDLSDMAGRIRRELELTEPQRRVEWHIEPGLGCRGDVRMIEVVMRNLLGNAWKYTAGVAEPVIRVYAERTEDDSQFCVADNGAGFDMAHAGKLFLPFQRLHRQDEFQGIGIGLATAQRIVQRHGGMIHGEGEPGKGAAFAFSLPLGED